MKEVLKEEKERLTLTPDQIRKRLRLLNHPFYKFDKDDSKT